MPRAFCLIKRQPFYRHDAFMAGLAAAGFQVHAGPPGKGRPDDILVIWNRYGSDEILADRFESEGGTVAVAENGYLNPGGGNPKFDAHEGKPGYYALALDQHNGAGRWPVGGPERWEALGIEMKPPRENTGGYLLVCLNRPFGSRITTPPADCFVEEIGRCKAFDCEIRIRPHPGNSRPASSLEEDLAGCWNVLTWSSTAGLHALIAGIPVKSPAPWWHGTDALISGVDRRKEAFERLAWAQWHIYEIASGKPFERLMECTSTAPATLTT